jgi:hypothetical protein
VAEAVEVVRALRAPEVLAEVAPAQLRVQVLQVDEVQLLLLEPVPRMDEVQARLLVLLLPLFQRRAIRLPLVVAVADKLVLVVVVAVVVVAAAEAERLRLATAFARAPQFPAWRSSMPCS